MNINQQLVSEWWKMEFATIHSSIPFFGFLLTNYAYALRLPIVVGPSEWLAFQGPMRNWSGFLIAGPGGLHCSGHEPYLVAVDPPQLGG